MKNMFCLMENVFKNVPENILKKAKVVSIVLKTVKYVKTIKHAYLVKSCLYYLINNAYKIAQKNIIRCKNNVKAVLKCV